jgi:pyrroline-5-carboxylate reductase
MQALAVAGFGKLGSAIVRGAIDAGVVRAGEVTVWARSEARQAEARAMGLQLAEWPDAIGAAPRVLLALKPQAFAEMTAERPRVMTGALVMSVIGGWRATDIGARLGVPAVVRAMPTIAAQVRASTTALFVPGGVPTEHAAFARRLFESIGPLVPMDERRIDTATAACGSGVGFACLFAEALEAAAAHAGADAKMARALALGAIEGAARCLRERGMSPTELRAQVTSPNGTTAAGVHALQSAGFEGIVARAVEAARARAAELGAQANRG